jgi:hypothetical protein
VASPAPVTDACPGLVCILGWFVPESPRRVVAKDGVEEAKAFIIKYHADSNANNPIVAIEMHEVEDSRASIGLDTTEGYFGLRSLVKIRARLYRLTLIIATARLG